MITKSFKVVVIILLVSVLAVALSGCGGPGGTYPTPPENTYNPPERTYQPTPERTYQPTPERTYQPTPERTYQPTPERTYQPTPTPKQVPDLAVASVQIYPSEPRAGIKFSAVVYVKNIGNAASGQYDLAMNMIDVSRGYKYPIGTFRVEPMQLGENYGVWSSNDLMVNDPGSYQFWVEIKPFLFTDGNEQNNVYGWQFTVLP